MLRAKARAEMKASSRLQFGKLREKLGGMGAAVHDAQHRGLRSEPLRKRVIS
jgi:hypothetical protein